MDKHRSIFLISELAKLWRTSYEGSPGGKAGQEAATCSGFLSGDLGDFLQVSGMNSDYAE